MKAVSKFFRKYLHWFIVGGVALLCALFMIFGHVSENGKYITLDGKDAQIPEATKEFAKEAEEAMLTYAKDAVPTLITNANGEEETISAPTVEAVDVKTAICPDGVECGVGKYIYAPVDTATAFKNYTINKCWNTDGYYGAQCWDLGDLFWQNYAGRNLSTCGTGAAKGAWDCRSQNAGNEFSLITDPKQLKLGDWIIFNNGQYGHVGMAMGRYNNGYIALLGQNQGGSACSGGGSSTNIINISLSSFAGAFRPKTYVDPEPTPTPTPTPTPVSGKVNHTVVRGETLGQIIRNTGYAGSKLFGDNGLAQRVADENGIANRGLIYPLQVIVIDTSLFRQY